MNLHFRLRYILLFLIFWNFGFAQQTESETNQSLLWEITGENLPSRSFLFGTYHLLCKDDYKIPTLVEDMMEHSEQVYMELNLSDPQVMESLKAEMMRDRRVTEDMGKKEILEFQKYADKAGLPGNQLAAANKMGFMNVVMMKMSQCPPESLMNIDTELMQEALSKDIKVHGLETPAEQMSVMDTFLSKEEILRMLKNFTSEKYKMQKAVAAYQENDMSKLKSLLYDNKEMTPEQRKVLLEDRNTGWLPVLEKAIQEKSTFIMVGAGHLMGKKGLVELLKAKGYTLRPLQFSNIPR